MKIEFVAFDSFGVKSMCTMVSTKDCSIVIDPGIAWEEESFPLSYKERVLLDLKYRRAIKKACRQSNVIVITHYHYDHHIPEGGMYKGKVLLIKDPKRNINKSQRERAAYLLDLIGNKADIRIADANEFRFGKTKVCFSKALWHGTVGTKLGKVVMCCIDDGRERLLFTSDLDGPYIKKYVELIADYDPDYLIIDGFPSYLLGFIASFANLKKVLKNTIDILKKTECKWYIIDHHLLRDYRYREIYYEVYRYAKESGKKVLTAAEMLGRKPKVIEGYEKHGPTRWKNWQRFDWSYLNRVIKRAKGKAQKKIK